MKNNINQIGKEVIDLQIKALRKLKNSIDKSFDKAVKKIIRCKSKVIVCGVGKSGKIASKISSTLSSVGTPSFSISANDCSHGDLGKISKQDVLILISYSGNTEELKNIINYAKMNKIFLIGIVSNKDSYLYKSANIKLFIPKVEESGYGIVPTSSTTAQLSLGDALSITLMKKKKFSKLDFKKFHPGGSLSIKLKTIEDLMLKGRHIPFVNDSISMKSALKQIEKKGLGVIVVKDNRNNTNGILTDGDLKRLSRLKYSFQNLKIRDVMKKRPISVDKNMLAAQALSIMNTKKITSLCVHQNNKKNKTIGFVHIHSILNANIT